jgi:PAS domain S-box-containing protein
MIFVNNKYINIIRSIYSVGLAIMLAVICLSSVAGQGVEGFPVAQIIDSRSGFDGHFPSGIVVDNQKRIWVGSELGGLFVGDGIRFIKVKLSPELEGEPISDICTDNAGEMWVLSSGGLGRLKNGSWQTDTTLKQSDPINSLKADGIFKNPDGLIIVMTGKHAYRILPGNTLHEINLPGQSADGDPGVTWNGKTIVVNRKGNFWQGSENNWKQLPSINITGSEHPIGSVKADIPGYLYLLTNNHLYYLVPGAGSWSVFQDIIPDNSDRISCLNDGRIWILRNGYAISVIGGRISRNLMPQNLPLYGAVAKYIDTDGNLWISGSNLIKVVAFGLIRTPSGAGYPPAVNVWDIILDQGKNLWVASEAGLFRQDSTGWHIVTGVESPRHIDEGLDGRVYIRNKNGIFRVEIKTLKVENVSLLPLSKESVMFRGPVICGNNIWFIDNNKRLIKGEWQKGKLIWQNDNLPVPLNNDPKESIDIMKDNLERLWIVSNDKIFCRFEDNWEELPKLNGSGVAGLSFNIPDEGLIAQYNPPSVLIARRINSSWSSDPLVNPDLIVSTGVLYSILKDHYGKIWLGTQKGVVCIVPGNPPSIQRFGIEHGLMSDKTNQWGLISVNGNIWVGTELGLSVIKSDKAANFPPLSKPSLLRMQFGSDTIIAPDTLISIEYSKKTLVLDLGFPGSCGGSGAKFEYRKPGGSWFRLAGNTLQFPIVTSGKHIYEVRVMPIVGKPGPSLSVHFKVNPPWYKRSVVYLTYFILATILISILGRIRTQKLSSRNQALKMAIDTATKELRKQRDSLESMVEERTHKLESTLADLQMKNYVFESSLAANCIFDLEGFMTEVNSTFISLWGYPAREEITGKHLMDLFLNFEEVVEILSALKDKSLWEGELIAKRKDGSSFFVHCLTSVMRDHQDHIVGYQAAIIDITLNKKAEEQLIMLRKAINSSGEVIFLTDSDGVFNFVNHGFESTYGYSAAEVIGKVTPRILKSDIVSTEVYKEFWGNLINRKEVKGEFKNKRKDGSIIEIEGSASAVLDDENRIIGFLAIQSDVTNRKKSEELQRISDQKARLILLSVIEDQKIARDELKRLNVELELRIEERTAQLAVAKEAAELANQSKSEFLANMSHEIRTPMNAVLGYSELLGNTAVDRTQREYLNSIKSSGRSLLTLINDILDLSKIEAGKLDLDYEFVDTHAYFSEFERIFLQKITEKGLKFILDISSLTPAAIHIDETRIRQIVFNLLGNAVKFTSEGSITLRVTTGNNQIITGSDDKTEELIDLIIEVSDTGVGISKEFQEQIFEPFTQEREYKNFGGTGLGMAITKRLVSMMQGTISVSSVQGKGSTFTVKVPNVAYQSDFSSRPAEVQLDISKILFEKSVVLIVDDINTNRNYLRDALKNTNLRIMEAGDGLSAYEMAKEINPDLIITDIRMPKMDGFQLLNKIKSDDKLKHIKVLAYSASVLKAQKERILKSEFSGLLIKPVNLTELYLSLINNLPFKKVSGDENSKPAPDNDLEIGNINDLSDLISTLETDKYRVWETFSVRQPMGEIRTFANDLVLLGRKHNSGIVTKYGNDMLNAADSFNIELLLDLIGKYKSIIELHKNLI